MLEWTASEGGGDHGRLLLHTRPGPRPSSPPHAPTIIIIIILLFTTDFPSALVTQRKQVPSGVTQSEVTTCVRVSELCLVSSVRQDSLITCSEGLASRLQRHTHRSSVYSSVLERDREP